MRGAAITTTSTAHHSGPPKQPARQVRCLGTGRGRGGHLRQRCAQAAGPADSRPRGVAAASKPRSCLLILRSQRNANMQAGPSIPAARCGCAVGGGGGGVRAASAVRLPIVIECKRRGGLQGRSGGQLPGRRASSGGRGIGCSGSRRLLLVRCVRRWRRRLGPTPPLIKQIQQTARTPRLRLSSAVCRTWRQPFVLAGSLRPA